MALKETLQTGKGEQINKSTTRYEHNICSTNSKLIITSVHHISLCIDTPKPIITGITSYRSIDISHGQSTFAT